MDIAANFKYIKDQRLVIEKVSSRLSRFKAVKDRYEFVCNFCNKGSASLFQARVDGNYVFKCFGCDRAMHILPWLQRLSKRHYRELLTKRGQTKKDSVAKVYTHLLDRGLNIE